MTSPNRRREPRLPTALPVSIVKGRRAIAAEAAEVSYRGLFVRTDEVPALRSLVRLRVELDGGSLEAHGMVVHVQRTDAAGDRAHAQRSASGNADANADANPATRGTGVGLQLWGLAGPARLAWERYVRELARTRNGERSSTPVPTSAA